MKQPDDDRHHQDRMRIQRPPTEPSSAINIPTALFDLDGVLSRRDTMATLARGRLKSHPARLIAALPLFLLAKALAPQARLWPIINRRLVTLALRGMSEEQYREVADATAHLLAVTPGNVPAAAVSECRAAAGQGRLIITTASEEHLARAYLQRIGLGTAELMASTLTFTDHRAKLSQHNVGATKVRALEAKDIDIGAATLYTDSASDLPLAEVAAVTFLVNSTPRTRRIMARRRIPHLQVRSWPS